jgi:hypothetical protein
MGSQKHLLDPSDVGLLALLENSGGLKDFTEVGVWESQLL